MRNEEMDSQFQQFSTPKYKFSRKTFFAPGKNPKPSQAILASRLIL